MSVVPFVAKDWQNDPAGGTKINEASLEDLEARVTDYADDRHESTRAKRTTNTVVTASTWTRLALDAEEWDDDGWHDIVTNNQRITVPVAGLYLVSFQTDWAVASDATRRISRVAKYAAAGTATDSPGSGTATDVVGVEAPGGTSSHLLRHSASAPWKCVAGDFFQLWVYHEAAANRTVGGGWLSVARM